MTEADVKEGDLREADVREADVRENNVEEARYWTSVRRRFLYASRTRAIAARE